MQANLNTVTITNIVSSNINIKTSYIDLLPSILSVEIMEEVGILQGVEYEEGELLVQLLNNNITLTINEEGELILLGNQEVLSYSLNEEGELIYIEN